MSKHRPSARIGRGHSEIVPTPEGELRRVEDVVSYDLPQESAFLMTVDGLQDPELKKLMLETYRDIHNHRKDIENRVVERNERRQDRALEASIRLNQWIQIGGFVAFLLVFAGFMWAVLLGLSYKVLLTFSVFFLGSAGIYALRKFGDKGGSSAGNK